MNKSINKYIDKQISGGKGETFPYGRMPTEKCRRNNGNRYSSLGNDHDGS